MKALVLGGGSMKGAFQVGVVKAILDSGFQPDMIYGISVGALNAAFLVNEAGRQSIEHKKIDWEFTGKQLIEFWIKNIKSPQDVAHLRSRMALGIYTLLSKFDGLLDSAPLHDLIRNTVDPFILRNSPIKLKIGAVNIKNGDMVYRSPTESHFLDYVLASASLPMLMPAVAIENTKDMYLDGGLRVVAPVKKALEDGATEIMLVACHAKQLRSPEKFNPRNLIALTERVKDITVNQLVNNDIAWAESYVERSTLVGTPIQMTIFRPEAPLSLDLLSFTSEDISRLIVEGYKVGTQTLRRK